MLHAVDPNVGNGIISVLDCYMVEKSLLFFCMMLCFCGFVQAASNEDMAESADGQMVAYAKVNTSEFGKNFQGKLCISKLYYDLYEDAGFPIPGDVVVEKVPNNKCCFVASSDEEFLENLSEFGKKAREKLLILIRQPLRIWET